MRKYINVAFLEQTTSILACKLQHSIIVGYFNMQK